MWRYILKVFGSLWFEFQLSVFSEYIRNSWPAYLKQILNSWTWPIHLFLMFNCSMQNLLILCVDIFQGSLFLSLQSQLNSTSKFIILVGMMSRWIRRPLGHGLKNLFSVFKFTLEFNDNKAHIIALGPLYWNFDRYSWG